MMDFKMLWSMIKEATNEWFDDRCPKLAAALSFYTMIALAPLLVLLVTVGSFVIDKSDARQHVVQVIAEVIGMAGAKTIDSMLVNAQSSKAGTVAAVLGFITFLIGATGIFVELKDSLDVVWNVHPKKRKSTLLSLITERLVSVVMIFGVGFILVASLVLSTLLSAVAHRLGNVFPGMDIFWNQVHLLLFVFITTMLFSMLFRFLPSIRLRWRDVWMGSFLTALLFTIGKSVIGAYLGRGSFGSVYGAAGSFVVILLWVYYSAQIFFWGAEFTQVYTRRIR